MKKRKKEKKLSDQGITCFKRTDFTSTLMIHTISKQDLPYAVSFQLPWQISNTYAPKMADAWKKMWHI